MTEYDILAQFKRSEPFKIVDYAGDAFVARVNEHGALVFMVRIADADPGDDGYPIHVSGDQINALIAWLQNLKVVQ